jgi:hypothetical protein
MKRESISFGDRLAAAVISALIIGFTAFLGPAVFIIGGQWVDTVESLFLVYGTFHAWGSAVVLFAFVAGFVLGTERVTEVFGHLWYTAEPRRPGITLTLWTVLVGIAVAGYSIFWKFHAP